MNAGQMIQADLIDKGAQAAVERARERVLEEAKEIQEWMSLLIARIEGDPVEAHPPAGIASLQHAVELDRLMVEWAQAKVALRAVRRMRGAVAPEAVSATPPEPLAA